MLSSIADQTGGVTGPHYALSKAGFIGLMHSYANLLAKEGITANAIAPALIETDMIKENSAITPDRIPIDRFGRHACRRLCPRSPGQAQNTRPRRSRLFAYIASPI